MKTGEMMKCLMENERLTARTITGNKERIVGVGLSASGTRCVISITGIAVLPIDEEWELVPQEVTWQEAISALLDGKKVHYIINGNKVHLADSYYLRVMDGARPISKDELSKCKWFVE